MVSDIDRRKFIRHSSIGLLFLALHPECALPALPKPPKKSVSLIRHIQLETHASLEVMEQFYLQKLQLPLEEKSSNHLKFRIGDSTISFLKKRGGSAPWYHFAFNIPQNKLMKAREWHLKHTPLIETPPRLRDPAYPKDVRHFRHWNAHSLFFWDPAGNLLEYIARHDLSNDRKGSFSSKDLLNISEIGFVVDDQMKHAQILHKELGLNVYPKGDDFWWAMGNENGLLLCLRQRLWAENTPDEKAFDIFPTTVDIRLPGQKSFQFDGFPYKINKVG